MRCKTIPRKKSLTFQNISFPKVPAKGMQFSKSRARASAFNNAAQNPRRIFWRRVTSLSRHPATQLFLSGTPLTDSSFQTLSTSKVFTNVYAMNAGTSCLTWGIMPPSPLLHYGTGFCVQRSIAPIRRRVSDMSTKFDVLVEG